MATFENRLAGFSSPVLSVFRIIFGLLFTLHGTMKVFGWPLGAAIPVGSWPGWWAGIIELVTGLLILVGLFTRIAAFVASGHMAVAYIWQHWMPNGFWPYDAGMGGNGGEPALMYCFAFLLLAALGGGSLSLDARRRGAMVGGGARGQRVVSGTAAPGGGVVTGRGAAPRGGLLSRFRRNRY
jgi:putative oxidoreductase